MAFPHTRTDVAAAMETIKKGVETKLGCNLRIKGWTASGGSRRWLAELSVPNTIYHLLLYQGPVADGDPTTMPRTHIARATRVIVATERDYLEHRDVGDVPQAVAAVCTLYNKYSDGVVCNTAPTLPSTDPLLGAAAPLP